MSTSNTWYVRYCLYASGHRQHWWLATTVTCHCQHCWLATTVTCHRQHWWLATTLSHATISTDDWLLLYCGYYTVTHLMLGLYQTHFTLWCCPTVVSFDFLFCSSGFHLIHELAILCLIPWIRHKVVYLYMLIIVTCLIVSVCRGNLAFKCHLILSKIMEMATSIYLFLIYQELTHVFGTIRLLGLLAGSCSM